MKHMKKMLVVLIAVMMIASMSAVAFASGSVQFTLENDKNVSVRAINAVGMMSFDFIITADDGIVLKNVKASADAAATQAADNSYTVEKNMAEGKFAGYFKENLWDLDAWVAAADDLGEEIPDGFDPTNFDMGTIVFDASGATGPAYIYVKGMVKSASGDISVDEKILVVAGKDDEPSSEPSSEVPSSEVPSSEVPSSEVPSSEVPSSEVPSSEVPSSEVPSSEVPSSETPVSEEPAGEAPSKDEPSKDEPSSEEPSKDEPTKGEEPTKAETPTKKPQQVDGGVNTGDNMALAAAFGVVALAGAAFVLTKKRK